MYSLVIKKSILVNKALLDDITIPAIGCNIANVLELIPEPFPIKILVTINNNSFYSNFYKFL